MLICTATFLEFCIIFPINFTVLEVMYLWGFDTNITIIHDPKTTALPMEPSWHILNIILDHTILKYSFSIFKVSIPCGNDLWMYNPTCHKHRHFKRNILSEHILIFDFLNFWQNMFWSHIKKKMFFWQIMTP